MSKEKVSVNPEIENYNEKLAQNPTSRVFAPLADAYRKSGMLDEAIEVCIKGLTLHPNYMSAHVVLGKIYLQKNLINEARDEFEKVLDIDPDNLVALTMLGEILRKLNNLNEAKLKYEKILKLDPFNDNAKKSLEIIRVASLKTNVTEEEVINIYQEDAEIEKHKEVPKEKETSTRKTHSWKAEDSDINTLTMAELYFKQGMSLEAKKVCKKILLREPDNIEAKKLLQRITLEENKKAEPIVSAKKSAENVPYAPIEIKISPEPQFKQNIEEISKPIKSEPILKEDNINISQDISEEFSFKDVYKDLNKENAEKEKIIKVEEKTPSIKIEKEQIPISEKTKTPFEIKHTEKQDAATKGFEDFIILNKDTDSTVRKNIPITNSSQQPKIPKTTPKKSENVNPLEDWLDLIKAQEKS
ncbi:tetratricopeptide repeat protein [Candidatus Poribacteria bacterium]|nr:tetratricopeptide repeat protein [Candidatus Poribacteria bacterium]